MKTTFIDWQTTNEVVFRTADQLINQTSDQSSKQIIKISEYYESQRQKLIIEIINTQQTDPIRNICIDAETLQLMEYNTKRDDQDTTGGTKP